MGATGAWQVSGADRKDKEKVAGKGLMGPLSCLLCRLVWLR